MATLQATVKTSQACQVPVILPSTPCDDLYASVPTLPLLFVAAFRLDVRNHRRRRARTAIRETETNVTCDS